ncbi:MAG TPA: hypothetical protein VF116_22690, partial [Ktedonobacterales bacterium]
MSTIPTDTKVIRSPRTPAPELGLESVEVAALRAVLGDMTALHQRLLALDSQMRRSAIVASRRELHPTLDAAALRTAARVEYQAVMRDRQALVARIEVLPPLARRTLIAALA